MGGWNGSTMYDTVEVIPVSAATPYDTGSNTPSTCRGGNSAAYSQAVYFAEGYPGSYSNDVHRIPFATITVLDTAAEYEDAAVYIGACATELKYWITGGVDASVFYNDTNWMIFATETFTNIEVGLTSGRAGGICVATPHKVIFAGGRKTGAATSHEVDGWTHSVETFEAMDDLPGLGDYFSGGLSDTRMYAAYADNNWAMALSLETWATLDTSSISQLTQMGDGSFGTGFLKPGGEVSGSATENIGMFSFATETYYDSGYDMTQAKYNSGFCSG